MKLMKKMICLFLTLTMLLSVALPALAVEDETIKGSILIDFTKTDGYLSRLSFSAFKLLDIEGYKNDEGEYVSYSYSASYEWLDFYADYFGLDKSSEAFPNDALNAIIDLHQDGVKFWEFQSAAISRADGIEFLFEQDGEAHKLNHLPLGAYVVVSRCEQCGERLPFSFVIVDPVSPDKEIALPYYYDHRPDFSLMLDKDGDLSTTNDRSNTAVGAIGDIVTYVIEEQIPHMCAFDKYFYVMRAYLSNGITFPYNVDVRIGDKILEEGTDYEVVTYENEDSSTFMELNFKDFVQYSAPEYVDATMTISYNAILNSEAEVGAYANINSVYVLHSVVDCEECENVDDLEEHYDCTQETINKDATIFSGALEIAVTDELNNRLIGAEFTLCGESKNVVRKVTNAYEVSETGTYWKLKNGTYTNVSPDAVVDGVPVNPDNYESVTTKYEKREMRTTDGVSPEEAVMGVVGDDGILCFEGLGEGTYQIRETQAPDEHPCLSETIEITVALNEETGELEYQGALTQNGEGHIYVVHKAGVELPSEKMPAIRHTLNLAEDIALNYVISAIDLEGYDMETLFLNAKVPQYVDNECTGYLEYPLQPERRGDYYYFTLEGLTAVQMNDTLQAELVNYDGVKFTVHCQDEYSIATYAMTQLNKDGASKELKALCADLLRYGAKAQIFKGYRTDALADANMSDVHKSYLADLDSVSLRNLNMEISNGGEPALEWYAKGLDLNTKVGLTFMMIHTRNINYGYEICVRYQKQDGTQVSYIIDPDAVEMFDFGDGRNGIRFAFHELPAAELRTPVCITVYDEQGNPISNDLIYSAESYACGKTGTLSDVCKALFAYSDSAKAFFTK